MYLAETKHLTVCLGFLGARTGLSIAIDTGGGVGGLQTGVEHLRQLLSQSLAMWVDTKRNAVKTRSSTVSAITSSSANASACRDAKCFPALPSPRPDRKLIQFGKTRALGPRARKLAAHADASSPAVRIEFQSV